MKLDGLLKGPRRPRRWGRWLLGVLGLLIVAWLASMIAAPLPEVTLGERLRPPAVQVPGLSVCWVEYTHGSTLGIAASRGWPTGLTWDTTTSGLLVRHPQGSLLIDVGVSSQTPAEAESLPWFPKTFIRTTAASESFRTTLPEALARVGVEDPRTLRWLLPTHGHFDHLGGLMDLPSVPVLFTDEELAFVRSEAAQRRLVFDEHVKALEARREVLTLRPQAYEGFPESADVFGEGSVVAVRLPGHTPGHLGVIVNVSPTMRLFYVGDAVSAEAGIAQRVPKSFILGYTDEDGDTAGKTVSVLSALRQQAPELTMIPGHDRAPWLRVFGPEPGCIGAPAAPAPLPAPSTDGGVAPSADGGALQ